MSVIVVVAEPITKPSSLPELVVNALALTDQFKIEEETFQPVLEELAGDCQTIHHFRPGGIAGYVAERRLLVTMKDEFRLIGTLKGS